ncbi:MAG: aspartate--tRNA ligase [Candidatus Omnitrophota bacterium]
MLRTHTCGELTEKNIGEKVTLCGWVDTLRDHGGLSFIDLRDRYGKTQLVVGGAGRTLDRALKTEDCVRVRGTVQRRPNGTENAKLATGNIEIVAEEILDHNPSQPLPFEITKSTETNEELRMTYRYLDLRNPKVQQNLFLRHRIYQIIRRTLDKHQFIEVETPILTKSTPEGARDYLVPSRVNQGEFFALPQSPQLFKQILMVAGFDRYFQIAKCFRDEDLRADRQPEFTQLDMEMSFLEEKDLFTVIEEVLKEIFKEVLKKELPAPFPRLTYGEAMSRYGSDKPDLRFGMEFQDVSGAVKGAEFKVFQEVLSKPGGAVAGFCLKGGAEISRSEVDGLTEFVKGEGALGLAYFKVAAGKLDSPIAKFLSPGIQQDLIQTMKASPGDLLLFIADERPKALKILGALRLHVAKWKKLIPEGQFHFAWVLDFPLFKYNEEEKRWESEHHPFTSPNEEDWKTYKNSGGAHPEAVRSRAYDIVLNGNEIGSGSIRIHSEARQKEIFDAIGLSKEEIEKRFGFLLKAFKFGAPPHGGIALGIDRVITILLGLDSIREVIAFPKNQKAVCPMTEAPSPVSERQLKELGIKIR